jgi:hypothetical protein
VLDFRRRAGPRNYLSLREQGRLLALVIVLGLVVVLAMEARKPGHYAWLWGTGQRGIESSVFEAAPAATLPSSVEPGYLESIRDNAPFRAAERDAWWAIFEILQESRQATLNKASNGRVTYLQLSQQSEQFRGELVTMRGTLRRAHRLKAPENELGISDYYQTWITPSDSPGNVVVVYCLHLPEGFPTGMKVSEEVGIVGFYFKRWAYEAQDRVRLAPVVLARTLQWQRSAEAVRQPQKNLHGVLLIVVAASVFALLVSVCIYHQSRRGGRSAAVCSARLDLGPEAEILPEAGQSLRQLSDEEQAPRP